MPSLTIKLPESLRQKVESIARISGRSVFAVVRDAIDASLQPAPRALSLFERTRDLCCKGKSDTPNLATNAKHMKGYGA